jgi:hypothetical protein
MTVKLSPIFNDSVLDNNGLPLSGGKIYWYLAGTSTPATTFTSITGSVAQANPIILNTRGETASPIWLTTGQAYKAVLADSTDAIIRTIDNITGINDVATPAIDEWLLLSKTATYISSTSFSVLGDETATFTTNRRVKIPIAGGNCYASVSTATYNSGTARTTMVIVPDSSGLDVSISAVYYGFFNPLYPSYDTTQVNSATKENIQKQTYVFFDTAGAGGNYTLTTVPATTALTDGQKFSAKVNHASSNLNTINVNGLGVKPLRQFDKDGGYTDTILKPGQIIDIVYSDDATAGGGWVVTNPIPSALDDSLNLHKATNETVTGIKTFNVGAEPKGLNLCKAWGHISCANYNDTAPTNQAYSVVSNQCTVTEANHTKILNSIVNVDAVSGGLPDGVYTVNTVSTSAWGFAATTADTFGNLKTNGFTRNAFNVHHVARTAQGEIEVTLTNPVGNASYAVLVTTNDGEGQIKAGSRTTSTFKILLNSSSGTATPDRDDISFLVYGV